MSTPLIPTLRLAAFGVVSVFSLIVLALSAHLINTTTTFYGGYFSFSALGVATAVLTMLTLPVMLAVDNMRKGAFTSMIIVELAWLGFLWVLWLSSAATASQVSLFVFGGPTCGSRSSRLSTACREASAIQAFSYLNWFILFGYIGTLLAFSIMAATRGYKRVWFQSVKDTEFNAPPVPTAPVVQPIQTQQYAPTNTGVTQQAYPPGSPAPGWTGQPQQQAPVVVQILNNNNKLRADGKIVDLNKIKLADSDVGVTIRRCDRLHSCIHVLPLAFIARPSTISRQINQQRPLQHRNSSSFRDQNAVGVFTPKSAALFVAAGVGLFLYFRYEKAKLQERREEERASKQYGRPQIGGPFTLMTPDGQNFSEQNLLGKWSLVYFGFTNCPDICPEELDKVTAVLDVIEEEHGTIFQPVFISVDPARDTPSRIGKYLEDFHSSFVGLVGTYDATKAVCKAYRVYFSTPPNADPAGDYLVDHSIFVYLMDPAGKFVEAFGQAVPKEDIIEKIRDEVNEWKAETGKKV
ncbi:hypothetical protein D9615_000024 [Tricholomella constricta]|uniref:Thioredoxin domain-containing protein n=1 Tax=Tricholomella constricta TaxID=117010 RepID=A0A8H5HRF1_9AGAR|nr:hypothetical protein D9615_000024 [Tricholomella constricta]